MLGQGELAYGSAYLAKTLPLAHFPYYNARTSSKPLSAIKPYIIKELNVGKDKKKRNNPHWHYWGINCQSRYPESTDLKFTDQQAAIEAITKNWQQVIDAIIVIKNDGLEVNGITAATHGKFGITAATPGKFRQQHQ